MVKQECVDANQILCDILSIEDINKLVMFTRNNNNPFENISEINIFVYSKLSVWVKHPSQQL